MIFRPERSAEGNPAASRRKKRKFPVPTQSGYGPEPLVAASASEPTELELEEPAPRPGFFSRPLVRWVVLPLLGAGLVVGGIGVALFRSIQSYSYYEWTLLPTSDTRIEAHCGELKLYYLLWQNPRQQKPFGHMVKAAVPEQCGASKTNPNPADRFRGLANPEVLKTLGCKPEGGNLKSARAWSCTQPVGALLRQEIEGRSSDRSAESLQ